MVDIGCDEIDCICGEFTCCENGLNCVDLEFAYSFKLAYRIKTMFFYCIYVVEIIMPMIGIVLQ